jgi:hypothetical protein
MDDVKLIRVATARFLYITPPGVLQPDEATWLAEAFRSWWPGAQLLIVSADEYHDASGASIDTYRHDARSA